MTADGRGRKMNFRQTSKKHSWWAARGRRETRCCRWRGGGTEMMRRAVRGAEEVAHKNDTRAPRVVVDRVAKELEDRQVARSVDKREGHGAQEETVEGAQGRASGWKRGGGHWISLLPLRSEKHIQFIAVGLPSQTCAGDEQCANLCRRWRTCSILAISYDVRGQYRKMPTFGTITSKLCNP